VYVVCAFVCGANRVDAIGRDPTIKNVARRITHDHLKDLSKLAASMATTRLAGRVNREILSKALVDSRKLVPE